MAQLPKLYLLLSSVLVLAGCSISKYRHLKCEQTGSQIGITPVIKPERVSKYNASIDILKNHLTGLLIIKQTDSATTRMVFVTELGMKMFDFEVKNKEVNAVYVFEPLNKPQLIEALKRNFGNMLLLNIDHSSGLLKCSNKNFKEIVLSKKRKEKRYYSGANNGSGSLNLDLQETFHNHKQVSKINYIYNISSQTYSQIKCKQYGLIKFYFELNEIQKTNE